MNDEQATAHAIRVIKATARAHGFLVWLEPGDDPGSIGTLYFHARWGIGVRRETGVEIKFDGARVSFFN